MRVPLGCYISYGRLKPEDYYRRVKGPDDSNRVKTSLEYARGNSLAKPYDSGAGFSHSEVRPSSRVYSPNTMADRGGESGFGQSQFPQGSDYPQYHGNPQSVQFQRNVKPPTFDGTTNLGDFLIQFEMVSQLAGVRDVIV